VKNALDVKANYIVSTDMSCLLHIDSYLKKQKIDMKVMHITDVLVSGWE
jgi:L-lactate dehydrogenase complex protein LldE